MFAALQWGHDLAKLDFETAEQGAGGSGPQMPASRHYRKARHDRGAETRQRLILAALDAFGRFGFDAASTRDIAKRADANLAAIVYHFGSKESLHRAVADYVIEQITRHKQAHYDDARALLAGNVDKQSARDMLQTLISAQIENMLGEAEAELWSRFIMREQMEPTSSFDSVYDHLCQAQDPVSGLIGVLFEIDPNSDEAILQTSALIGQVFIFLVGQPMILRKLGRDSLGLEDRAMITRIVSGNIDRAIGYPFALSKAA